MRWECRERFPHHRFQRKPLVSDLGMPHGTCVTHVSGSLTHSGGKRSRHSQRMRNPQFCVSGKRPILYATMSLSNKTISSTTNENDVVIHFDFTMLKRQSNPSFALLHRINFDHGIYFAEQIDFEIRLSYLLQTNRVILWILPKWWIEHKYDMFSEFHMPMVHGIFQSIDPDRYWGKLYWIWQVFRPWFSVHE